MKLHYTILLIFALLLSYGKGISQGWQELASPVVGDVWVQPAQGKPAQPIWGHVNGIRVGLSPMPGPRGLIRIYTPYLGHKTEKVMNFFALEPVIKGSDRRGLSELEMSKLDGKRGKRFWSANDSLNTEPRPEDFPARGIVEKVGGKETLTLYVFSESFERGAKVYVKLKFYEDRPYEVAITAYAMEGSEELDNFIVTATMGNYARLRTLYLKNETQSSTKLWPDYVGDAFTAHAHFPVRDFITNQKGRAYFVAAPDEKQPQKASYGQDTNHHWKYYGKKATQYWYSENPDPQLEGLVNGRYTYWASKSPIPGGISFENFELKAPFKQGTKYVFGITPLELEQFIKTIKE